MGNCPGDVLAYLDRARVDSVVLLGHSLGGKVAMRLACDCPERVRQLVIADIAAKVYPPYHDAEFRAMRRIDLKGTGKSARGGAATGATDRGLGNAAVFY